MSSEVDICNLALAHLGDSATVASLVPPEGSAQAEHCARFYVIARDSLLELHPWNFATKRATLAELTNDRSEWDYCYAYPSDVLTVISVIGPDATDDYSGVTYSPYSTAPLSPGGMYVPQPFTCEINVTGARVIYTDQEDAVLRYVARITDTTKYSPLFVTALSWHLASMLAGPIIKGESGAAEAKRCLAMAERSLTKAAVVDTNQRNIKPTHTVSWLAGR